MIKVPNLKESEIENDLLCFINKIRKDGRSLVVTLKKDIILGSGTDITKQIYCQLVKFRTRPALLLLLDNEDYYHNKQEKNEN